MKKEDKKENEMVKLFKYILISIGFIILLGVGWLALGIILSLMIGDYALSEKIASIIMGIIVFLIVFKFSRKKR